MMRRLRRARPVTVVVTLVGMELVRSATGPAARLGADGLDGVDGGEHHLRIVHVRGAHQDRERDAVGVDHKMALRALFAAIRWVLARFWPPGAGHRGGVQRGPVPVDAIGLGPALREAPGAACARRPLGTSLATCASTSSRSRTHLGRQVLPGDARIEHEQDPRQRRPVRHPGPSSLGLRRLRREQRRAHISLACWLNAAPDTLLVVGRKHSASGRTKARPGSFLPKTHFCTVRNFCAQICHPCARCFGPSIAFS